jgi:hypothetical protein
MVGKERRSRQRQQEETPPLMTGELPNVAELLGQVLQRVPREQQPLLIAIAERLAAERYRGWADASAQSAGFLACAAREEEIARRVEGLYPDAALIQRDILAANPDLEDINRSIFAGRALVLQLTIQAQGERLGAATWRAFAEHADDPKARATFLDCALLEEASAAFLEGLRSARG